MYLVYTKKSFFVSSVIVCYPPIFHKIHLFEGTVRGAYLILDKII